MSDKSRAPFWLGLLGILLFAALSSWWMLREPPPPPKRVEPPKAVAPVVQLKLAQVSGKVEVRQGKGEFRDAEVGEVLGSSDVVRTQDGAYAVIVAGEAWEVKMEPGTEVEVGDLSQSISRLLLGEGMASANVKGSQVFEIRAKNADAVARTQKGEFTVSNNGQGTVAVASQQGDVEFEGKGRVVILRSGQRSLILPGEGPTDPIAIPSTLLLKVSLPKMSLTNKPMVTVTGQTEPGSHLQVHGHVLKVDSTGHFSSPIRLREGKNTVEIKAMSVGRVETQTNPVVEVDTHVRPTTIDRNIWGVPPSKKP